MNNHIQKNHFENRVMTPKKRGGWFFSTTKDEGWKEKVMEKKEGEPQLNFMGHNNGTNKQTHKNSY